jgi:hypothetical protein
MLGHFGHVHVHNGIDNRIYDYDDDDNDDDDDDDDDEHHNHNAGDDAHSSLKFGGCRV